MRSILIALIIASLNLLAQQNNNNLDASKYGVNQIDDMSQIFNNLIEICKKENYTKLVIPKGIYNFYPDKAFEKYSSISNNDNGLRRIAFPIIDVEDLEIDGQGSEFIFHGSMIPFVIENSKNISLKNFSIDWDKPFYLQGEVIAVDSSTNSFDVKISYENNYSVLEGELRFNANGHSMNFQQNLFFDPNTKAVVYNVWKYKIAPWNPNIKLSYDAEDLGNNIVRIKNQYSSIPEVGWILVAKGRTNDKKSRYAPGIHVAHSDVINIESLNIYHNGGMALIAEKSENITINKFDVKLRDGSKRIISATADATHFVNCKGKISITNCTFENMLDDATNFHGVYTRIMKIKNENKIGLKLIHHQQYGYDFADIGDSIRIINPKTFQPKYSTRVKNVKIINEEYFELELEDKLPSEIQIDDAVENISWHPDFVIVKNNVVRQNRARGFLLYTQGKFEIKNNYFSTMMAGIEISSGLGYFSESGSANDILIENNNFENCSNSGIENAVILIRPDIEEFDAANNYYHHKNIRIIGNTIKHFDQLILEVNNSENVLFTKNKIEKTDTYKPIFPENPLFKLSQSKNVKVVENDFENYTEPISAEVKQSVGIDLQKELILKK